MSLRSLPSSARNLKQMSYRLIKKMEDLERRGRRAKALQIRCEQEPCVLVEVEALRSLFGEMLGQINDSAVANPAGKFLKHLDHLSVAIKQNVKSNRPLRKGMVSRALSAHTATFRKIREQRIEVNMTSHNGELWARAIRAAVMVWDDHI